MSFEDESILASFFGTDFAHMFIITERGLCTMHANGKIAYINGKIYTCDDENRYAQAMTVEDGVITWVGAQEDLPAGDWERVDLGGKRVIPGFVDAHEHPVMLADFSKKISSLPPKVHSIEELKQEIRKVRQSQGPDKWIEGWGYDEGKLAEKRSPTRYDLDEGCSDAPVSIIRTCGHIRCVNSKALELAGITKDTPDPQGGKIDRDENGEPTGVLRENARNLVTPLIPETTEDQKVDLVVDLGELLLSQGITSICDMGNLDPSDNFDIYEKAVEKGFRQKVGVYYMWDFYAGDKNFLDCLNPASLEVLSGAKVEASLEGASAPASFQFLRQGYFCVDNKDSAPGHLVFNRSVSLKDSFKF